MDAALRSVRGREDFSCVNNSEPGLNADPEFIYMQRDSTLPLLQGGPDERVTKFEKLMFRFLHSHSAIQHAFYHSKCEQCD